MNEEKSTWQQPNEKKEERKKSKNVEKNKPLQANYDTKEIDYAEEKKGEKAGAGWLGGRASVTVGSSFSLIPFPSFPAFLPFPSSLFLNIERGN